MLTTATSLNLAELPLIESPQVWDGPQMAGRSDWTIAARQLLSPVSRHSGGTLRHAPGGHRLLGNRVAIWRTCITQIRRILLACCACVHQSPEACRLLSRLVASNRN